MAASREIINRASIRELTKKLKETFSTKTETAAVAADAAAAYKGAKVEGNAIKLYTETDTSGDAAVTLDLPAELVLDQTKTAFVGAFEWSEETYPGSTDPTLNGKPVLVLAVKGSGENDVYSFLDMTKLVDTYKAAAGDGSAEVSVNGYEISVNALVSGESGNQLSKKDDGLFVPAVNVDGKADKAAGATAGHLAGLSEGGGLTDSGIAAENVLTTSVYDTDGDGTVNSADEATHAQSADSIEASGVTFEDGETFQEKLDKGELTGPAGADGAANLDAAVIKQIALLAHPVGSYYWSSEKTSPTELFGGEWEAVEDRFLYAAKQDGEAGQEGGAATVALSAAEMPSHTHTGPSHTHTVGAHVHGLNSHTHTIPHHVHHIGPHSHTIGAHTHYEKGFHWCKTEATGYSLWKAQPVSGWLAGFNDRVLVENSNGIADDPSGNKYSTDSGGGGNTGLSGEGDLASNGGGGATSGPNAANTANSTAFETGGSGTGATGAAGSGTAHNNMPPYVTAYCWRRTA